MVHVTDILILGTDAPKRVGQPSGALPHENQMALETLRRAAGMPELLDYASSGTFEEDKLGSGAVMEDGEARRQAHGRLGGRSRQA